MSKITIQDMELPELLSLQEVADNLNVHPNTLREWDRKGILAAVRIGVRTDRRYRKEDIINLVKSIYHDDFF